SVSRFALRVIFVILERGMRRSISSADCRSLVESLMVTSHDGRAHVAARAVACIVLLSELSGTLLSSRTHDRLQRRIREAQLDARCEIRLALCETMLGLKTSPLGSG